MGHLFVRLGADSAGSLLEACVVVFGLRIADVDLNPLVLLGNYKCV